MRVSAIGSPSQGHLAGQWPDFQVVEGQGRRGRADRAGAAAQGPQPGGQFLDGYGLDQVVVGAGLEAGDDVVGVAAGADHDDRYVVVAAQFADALVAVEAGQHQVDQDRVGGLGPLAGQALLGGCRAVGRVPLVLQGEDQRQPDPVVILDHQYGRHRSIMTHPGVRRPTPAASV